MDRRRLFLWADIGLILLIIVSGIFLAINIMQGPPPSKVPSDIAYNVRYVSPTQVRVEFGNFSEAVNFSDMRIEITAPNGDVCLAEVVADQLSYPQVAEDESRPKSLTEITLSSTGRLEKGSYFLMTNFRDLLLGGWAFEMVHRPSGTVVSGGTIIIPDTDTAPTGSFSALVTVSSSEVRVMVGSVSPATHFTYCYMEVWGPDMTTQVMFMNDTEDMDILLTDETQLKMVDTGGDGLLNAGDYVSLKQWTSVLSHGQWSVTIKDIFTGERVALAVFDIT